MILSGGIPRNFDRQLLWLIRELESIDHLDILRIHSRIPIVLPQRITPELITILDQTRFDVVMVVHCNHSQEISENVKNALMTIQRSSVTLLNQSVILAGINDDTKILKELSHTLFSHGALPYYIHLPDKVAGTAHFSVKTDKAIQIIDFKKGITGISSSKFSSGKAW